MVGWFLGCPARYSHYLTGLFFLLVFLALDLLGLVLGVTRLYPEDKIINGLFGPSGSTQSQDDSGALGGVHLAASFRFRLPFRVFSW